MVDPRRWTLRTRMVVLGATVVAVVLVVAGVVLLAVLRALLIEDLARTTALRASDLASLAAAGRLPEPLAVGDADEAMVQVLDPDGEVIASSSNAAGLAPLGVAPPPPGATTVQRLADVPLADDGGGFVVGAATAGDGRDTRTVLLAVSTEDALESVAAVGALGLAALPVLVGALSLALWWIVGRTLAPVEAIRTEAAAIGDQEDLHRRVPQPARLDEIGLLATTLNGMLGRLDEAARRQRRFVADAAHELRSPIASLRAQLETARARDPDDDVVADVLAETVRMQRIADQLLLLARVAAGRGGVLQRRDVDLDDAVDRAVARMEPTSITIDRSGVEPVRVRADATLIDRAIDNLLDNAVRHAATTIRISTFRDDEGAVLVVEDDGPGIPPEERASVLRPFVRLDGARDRDRGGAGLGLAIVQDIAAAHGGSVTVGAGALGGAAAHLRIGRGDGGARPTASSPSGS